VRKILTAMFLALAVLGVTIWVVDNQGPVGTYRVTADVAQAPNLFEGGRVMVRGVAVGRIVDVEPESDHVRITMEIDDDVKVPENVSLSVIPITVISDRYVQLYPAYKSGPVLEDEAHIALAKTSIPAELDDVLKQLNGLLAALGPRGDSDTGPLSRLVVGLDKALKGRSKDLAGTIRGSSRVLENLADSQSDITGLISNLDTLFASLANRSSEIGLVNQRFSLVAQALAADQKDLEGTIENLAFLSKQGTKLVNESGESLAQSFSRLGRVIDAVLKHQDELVEGMKWSNVVAEALGVTDRSGKGLYAYTGRQASPGTPGAEYNYRIDQRDIIACERIEVVSGTILIITPEATIEEFMVTLLSFLPEVYDDDLAYILEQLIPLCTPIKDHAPTLSRQAAAEVKQLEKQIGTRRLYQLLGMWLLAGTPAEVNP
jgi:phospholipid/cholesterol/gamma-HCH transport system substrate-binding protein